MDGIHLKFSGAVKEFVDVDYWDKLDGAQTEWLKSFLEEEYNARPRTNATRADRARSYRKKYLARSDLFTKIDRQDVPEIVDADKFPQKRRMRSSKIAMIFMRSLGSQCLERN